jgi:hypothetical protein
LSRRFPLCHPKDDAHEDNRRWFVRGRTGRRHRRLRAAAASGASAPTGPGHGAASAAAPAADGNAGAAAATAGCRALPARHALGCGAPHSVGPAGPRPLPAESLIAGIARQ